MMQSDSVEYRSLDFLGFPDARIGSDGSVWSRRRGPWRKRRFSYSGPYPHVFLCHEKRRGPYTVAELVLMAFVGPRPKGKEVCHFPDPSPLNNQLVNLQWGTKKENYNHRRVHGTDCAGERHGKAVLSDWDVIRIRRSLESNLVLATRYRVHPQTIWCARRGISWRHL